MMITPGGPCLWPLWRPFLAIQHLRKAASIFMDIGERAGRHPAGAGEGHYAYARVMMLTVAERGAL